MADKLIIEIDGNSVGLTRELGKAEGRLNTFNTKISSSNKMLTAFQSKVNTSTNAITRLTATTVKLDASAKALNRSFASISNSMARLGKSAATASTAMSAASKSANSASTSLTKLASSSAAVNNMMTSMGRRMTALNTTISALNTALRGVTRNIQQTGTVTGGTTTIINRFTGASNAAGASAARTAGAFTRLGHSNLTMAEGFRRSVAQITALRTLTYQALFWFAPLVYSIIKVNSQYETQMMLLKNISKETSEAGKAQEAIQSRKFLVGLANNSPFALEQITNAFVKMKVGGVDPMNGSLQILLDSISAFGGGSAELDRAAVAIQQMGGKGVVSMEELRQQLGEHIPDAANAMAAGLGLTMGELFKVIESGTLESTNALAAMFEVLKQRHSGSSKEMMDTWAGQVARMKTAWQNFLIGVTKDAGPNSFIKTLKNQMEQLIKFMNSADGTKFMADIQLALSTLITTFATIIRYAVEYRDLIVKIGTIFAVIWGGNLMIGLITRLGTAYMLMNGKLLLVGRTLMGTAAMSARMKLQLAALATLFMRTDQAATRFGVSTNRVNGTLRAMNMTGGVTIGKLARIAGSALLAQGAFLLLAAAVWAVSAAYQAWNAQKERQAKLDNAREISAEGGTFADAEEREKHQARIKQKRSDLQHLVGPRGDISKDGGAVGDRLRTEIREDSQNFNMLEANWRTQRGQARASHAETTYNTNFQARVDRARGPYDNQIAVATSGDKPADNAALIPLRQRANEAEVAVIRRELGFVADKVKAGKDVPFWQARQTDLQNRLDGATAGGAALGNVSTTDGTGGEGKPKKEPAGPKTDGLDGMRSRYTNSEVSLASANHELQNLINGTDTNFDYDDAQDRAQSKAETIKQREVLEDLIAARKLEIQEIERKIFIEKGLRDINNEIVQNELDLTKALDELDDSYTSINTSSDAYRAKLMLQYDAELKAAKGANDAGAYYDKLINTIGTLVKSYEDLAVVDLAKAAKEANEKYDENYMSKSAVAIRDITRETLQYEEALAKASSERRGILSMINEDGEQLSLSEQERLTSIESSIPYLERRLEILQKERAIAELGPYAGVAKWADEQARTTDQLHESFGNLLGDSMNSFVDDLSRGKLAFGDFVKSMIKGLVAIILRALIAKAILGALGLGGPTAAGAARLAPDVSATMDANAGIFHTGGRVGGSAPTRSVDAGMFAFAQRYHTGGVVGLGPNEVPIIAEKGETVLTREQMKGMEGKNSGSNVQVNVINQTGTQADVERSQPRFDGEKWVEDIILKKITRPGPVRNALGGMR